MEIICECGVKLEIDGAFNSVRAHYCKQAKGPDDDCCHHISREALQSDLAALREENKRMKTYLQFLYDGDGNIEFDELEQALKG